MPDTDVETGRGVGRLVGFTDAVVAIAITLLVLPLVEAARSVGPRPALEFLTTDALSIWSAMLSFVVIASFWKEHHRLYQRVESTTPALINANIVWLAGIALLPLPTVLIVDSPGRDPVAAATYIGTILVSLIALRVQELILVRSNLLQPGTEPPRRAIWAEWTIVALTVLALVVTLAIPATGLYPLLLLLLARPIRWVLLRRMPVVDGQRGFR